MYVEHPKEFWDSEATYIEEEAKKPDGQRMGQFLSYVQMQHKHCKLNDTSPEATKRIAKILAALRLGRI